MDIYTKIKEIRLSKNLTAVEVAQRMGIGKSAYSAIENGKSDITLGRLTRVANALGVTVEELLLNNLVPSFEKETNQLKQELVKLNNEVNTLKSRLLDKERIIELYENQKENIIISFISTGLSVLNISKEEFESKIYYLSIIAHNYYEEIARLLPASQLQTLIEQSISEIELIYNHLVNSKSFQDLSIFEQQQFKIIFYKQYNLNNIKLPISPKDSIKNENWKEKLSKKNESSENKTSYYLEGKQLFIERFEKLNMALKFFKAPPFDYRPYTPISFADLL